MTRDDRRPDAAERWRLFLALPVPIAGAVAIHEALALYRRGYPEARWLDPRVYHVTLRFLGQVDHASVPAIHDAALRCASEGRVFSIATGRGGGTQGRSEVAWLELADGRPAVSALADLLDAVLPSEVVGDRPRTRPAPHLTIARRAPVPLVTSLTDERLGAVRVTWAADRLVLFRSFTGSPTGSRYEPLVEARLGGAQAA